MLFFQIHNRTLIIKSIEHKNNGFEVVDNDDIRKNNFQLVNIKAKMSYLDQILKTYENVIFKILILFKSSIPTNKVQLLNFSSTEKSCTG